MFAQFTINRISWHSNYQSAPKSLTRICIYCRYHPNKRLPVVLIAPLYYVRRVQRNAFIARNTRRCKTLKLNNAETRCIAQTDTHNEHKQYRVAMAILMIVPGFFIRFIVLFREREKRRKERRDRSYSKSSSSD